MLVGVLEGVSTGALEGEPDRVGAPLCFKDGATVGKDDGAMERDGAADGAMGAGVTGFGVGGGASTRGASSQPQLRRENICNATQLALGTKPCLDRSSNRPQVKVPYVGINTSPFSSPTILPLPQIGQYGFAKTLLVFERNSNATNATRRTGKIPLVIVIVMVVFLLRSTN